MRRKWRVLVVSQHIGLRTLSTIVFKRRGDQVDVVTSRAEAMSLIAQELPDLVIIDLYLSDEPGLNLTSDLRTRYQELPMLLVSLLASELETPQEDSDRAAHLGINILYKYNGIGSMSFHSMIHELLDRV